MEFSAAINAKINKTETLAILSLFKLDDKIAIRNLNKINFNNLTAPFNELLFLQKQLNENKNLEIIEQMIEIYKKNLTNDIWTYKIFEEILLNLFIIGNGTEKCIKTFQLLYRNFTDMNDGLFKECFILKIFNFLISLYSKVGNFKMVDNLFAVFICKDSYGGIKDKKIYSFFKGLYCMRKEMYDDAFDSLSFAMQIRNDHAKKMIAPYYYLCLIYQKKFPNDDILKKYDLMHLKKLFESIIAGNYIEYQNELDVYNKYFIELNLNRYMNIEIYYLVYRNLIFYIYNYLNMGDKLYLEDIIRCLNLLGYLIEEYELICIVMNLINKKYIKGYLNISLRVIVLRKYDPFPENNK